MKSATPGERLVVGVGSWTLPEKRGMHLRRWLTRALAQIVSMAPLLIAAPASHAMEFSQVQRNPRDGRVTDVSYLLMKGEIVPGDYDRLLRYAVANEINLAYQVVALSSPGGDITEALKIGRLVKSLYLSVSVGSIYGPCASACFIIYASAVDRSAEAGLVGVHRPYLSAERLRSLSPPAAEQLQTRALLEAEKYLHDLRVPRTIVDEMFEHASTEIYWLTEDELDRELGTRAAWYEEFLIARCHLDKEAEDRVLHDPAYHYLRDKVIASVTCGADLTLPDATKNFERAVAPYRKAQRQWDPTSPDAPPGSVAVPNPK